MVFLVSCENSDLSVEENPSLELVFDEYHVTEQIALEYSLSVDKNISSKPETSNNLRKGRKLKSSKLLKQEEVPLFYIFTFEEGGFSIIAADSRSMTLLAYSEGGVFDIDSFEKANGINYWIEVAKKNIIDIKLSNQKQSKIVEKEWAKYNESKNLRGNTNCQEWYTIGQYMCQNSFTQKGPLLFTKWGQEGLANYYTPDDNQCNWCHDNALAGCGPVAMAQTLRAIGVLHGNFGGFNFSIMPLWSYNCNSPSNVGETQMAQLIANCGAFSTTDYHFWSCETLTVPSSIPWAMSYLGLSSGGSISNGFNPNIVRAEINLNYPVILKGKDNLLKQHIWVCDGYDIHEYSEYNCDTHSCEGFAYGWYHMNWGWDSYYDGWYALGNFNPGGSNNFGNSMKLISGFRI